MNNQIIQNKPNFSKPKMVVTLVITMTNNNEQRTTNYSKQTQSNPILPAILSGGFIRLRRIQKVCLLFRFVAVLGAQGANE
jgi:hypothetical protein